LVEIVVVLFIVAIVIAMVAAVTRGLAAAQKRSLTATRIAGVEAAILQFVSQQKRLPCPADGRLESSDNNAGVELRNAAGCTNLQHGVVPWRAIALSETEATDGWDRRFTFRVQPALGADNAMDMSRCDPAGTSGLPGAACAACSSANVSACTMPGNFLTGKGLEVRNLSGIVLMNPAAAPPLPHTGAAYVLISHGESGGGGYLSSGQLGGSSVGDGTEELKNYASQAYVAGVTYYVDDSLVSTGGAGHFDDIVARPSVLAVATRAGLGPRSQP
jgi:type II secretory pathway pseudopilin PulG